MDIWRKNEPRSVLTGDRRVKKLKTSPRRDFFKLETSFDSNHLIPKIVINKIVTELPFLQNWIIIFWRPLMQVFFGRCFFWGRCRMTKWQPSEPDVFSVTNFLLINYLERIEITFEKFLVYIL